MEIIASRHFQSNYQRLVEPVVVKAKSRTLGTWYPAGTEPDPEVADRRTAWAADVGSLHAEIVPLKAGLANGPITVVSKPRTAVRAGVDRTLNNAPFTPVLK